MGVTPYYSEDRSMAAVLVSRGFGAGWSSWNKAELAYDRRVVEWWMKHHDREYCRKLDEREPASPEYKEFSTLLKQWGYDHVYLGGYEDIKLYWVRRGCQWRIEEYDGNERIVFNDEQYWNCL